MANSRIYRAWGADRAALGVHCVSADLAFYEIAGQIGYDFVWIDTEHAAITLPMVLNGIAATQANGAAALVRIAKNDPVLAKPILEMGADGIIFPMINSAADAEKAVKACLYPPEGERGFGPLRANRYGEIDAKSFREKSNLELLKIIQIEHIDAVNALDEILEVKGVDLAVCGPMDLSASVNRLGQLNSPEVRELMQTIIKKCKAAKMPFGISMGYDKELFDFWKESGAAFISMGNPYIYFRRAAKAALDFKD